MRISKALLVATACLMLGAAPALAQTAQDVEQAAPAAAAKVKAKAKKKVAKGKNAGAITILNARADGITSVVLTSAKGKQITAVKKSLPAGAKHAFTVPAGSGCDFTVSARFTDGTEFEPTPVNLCRDKTLRFTDGEGTVSGGAAADPGPGDDAQ